MTKNADIDFEEQIRLEEVEKQSSSEGLSHGQTKTDKDGTVFEWDAHQRAWFPKIDDDFIARYQMNYGNFEEDKNKTAEPSSEESSTANTDIPPAPPVTDPGYAHWYYTYYYKHTENSDDKSVNTSDKAYHDYWANYYKYYDQQQVKPEDGKTNQSDTGDKSGTQESVQQNNKTDKTEEQSESSDKQQEVKGKDETNKEGKEEGSKDDSSKGSYDEHHAYYEQYYKHYYQQDGSEQEGNTYNHEDYWKWYYTYYGSQEQSSEGEVCEEKEDTGEKKEEESKEESKDEGTKEEKDQKGKKRKAPQQPAQWFEMDQNKSTSVYIAGLPEDITDEDFRELMAKCGLIMLDPFARKLKLKLYRDQEGKPKGDGVCSYIKQESVDLALQILDGYDYNGYKLSVEKARFELKGDYDPKKKKKLSNKAKRKLKEKQEKLFDWRPDKPFGHRPKTDKIVVLKNVFDPKDFEKDPTLINEIRNDLRVECSKYGDMRKVIVYDRHEDGVCTVAFKEIEEADVCRDALNHRWFAQRRLIAETWDGKTKYDVAETEQEREARLKQWSDYLDDKDNKKKESGKQDGDKKDPSGASGIVDSKSKIDTGSSKTEDMSQAASHSESSAESGSEVKPTDCEVDSNKEQKEESKEMEVQEKSS